MRIGVTLDDNAGLNSKVSQHFGQCGYFLIADIENNKIQNAKVVPNGVKHGGGGCLAVDAILAHNITHVISGGMGMGAQNKFVDAGVKVFGSSGKAKDAIEALLTDTLGGLKGCDHSH